MSSPIETAGVDRIRVETKITVRALGKIIGYAILTIVGGWAALTNYGLQRDLRVLQLDVRISTLERKIDHLTELLEKKDAEKGDQKKQSPRP